MKLQIVYLISGEIVGYQVGASGAWEGLINWTKKWLIAFLNFANIFSKRHLWRQILGALLSNFCPSNPNLIWGQGQGLEEIDGGSAPHRSPNYLPLCQGMSGTVKGRDTIDCVRTLNCVQALDVMGFEIRKGDGLSCRISARGGGWVARFWARAARTLVSGAEGAGFENFWHFRKKIVS